QGVGLGQAGARAELVVERLSADSGPRRDVTEGDLGPVPFGEQVAHAVQYRGAQQFPRRLLVRHALTRARRSRHVHERSISTMKKSDLRAPQSGQVQSSGMSSQRVPGAMP